MSKASVVKARKHQSPLVAKAEGVSTKTKKDKKSKKDRKRSRHEIQEDDEERRLTAMIFGGDYQEVISHDDDPHHLTVSESDASLALFQLDTNGDAIDDDEEEVQNPVLDKYDKYDKHLLDQGCDDDKDKSIEKPVWVDDDDVELSIDILQTSRLRKLRTSKQEDVGNMDGAELEKRLRKRFEYSTMATARTDWARIDAPKADDFDEEEGDILGSSSAPLLSSSGRLPPQILQVVRCPDANQKDCGNSTLQSVHFHPGSDPDRPLMLTAGLDKTLRFFHVSAESSDKIHGIHFPKMPIYSAQFLGDSGKVAVSGRRSFFYIYDMVAGKLDLVPKIMGREEKSLERFATSPDGRTIAFLGNDGYIIMIDVQSKQWIADLKMNGSVRAVTFTPDCEQILASGSDGDVYRCVTFIHDSTIRFWFPVVGQSHTVTVACIFLLGLT
jgi:U3 small nucleolar RNA-associated protein 18